MSVNPTQYDLVQDGRLDDVESLVKNEYSPPSALEYSYPVVDQPMNDEMWQYVTLALGDGVLDTGGQPYHLRNLSNTTNTAQLTVSTTSGLAQAILRGFYHRLMADLTINLPPVSTATTYYIVLQYDPVGHQQPTGPISVKTVTSLDSTGGKFQLILWRVIRQPNQLLTDAAVEYIHPKVSPSITVEILSARPEPATVLWGTRCLIRSTRQEFMAVGQGANGRPDRWDPVTFTSTSGTVNLTVNSQPGATANISFPAGRFATPPKILVSKQGDTVARGIPYVRSITTTGAVVGVYTGDGTNTTGTVSVFWLAME